MPEDSTTENELERVVDDLEDYSLKARNYETLQDMLNSVDHITAPTAEKLLLLCIRDRIEDLQYTTHVLNIISTLLKKIENGQCTPLPDLVPSALAVLNVLCTTSECDKLEALKSLSFEIINSYPDETLISLSINHSDEIFKVIDLYCTQNSMTFTEFGMQTINIVGKVLRVLPSDKRGTFVKDGMKLWFSTVIPLIVRETLNATNESLLNLLETFELITEELVHFDYANNPNWQEVLVNIHTSVKYPAVMKSLLEKGSPYWHRLWIIFIKLLKNQITKCTGSASPINALLPCVELAFKMDVRNRCRAFLCWDVLIDNFSNETNDAYLSKRLKLLMVPLTSNNAKVEDTAVAKLKTWWYLITRFQTKLDKFVVMVVIPFLSFCFGKKDVNLLIPGKISDKTKVLCVQAFINIVGHAQCEGCVSLPKLNVKLFNTSLLVSNWRQWVYAIGNAIKICVEQNSEFNEKQIQCVWKTFIMMIGELPENNIRRDLYYEVLTLLEELTQDCDNRQMGVIVNVLIPTLFDRDDKILQLLKSKDEKKQPIHKIIAVLSELPLDRLEDRITALENIMEITNWMANDAFKTSSNTMELLVQMLSSNSVLLWTALANSISFCGYSVCPLLLAKMILWPFNYMNNFANKEESTTAWLNLYKTISSNIQKKSIHNDIINTLMTHGDNQSSCLFVLRATIAVLEHKLQQEDTHLDKEIDLILHLTSKLNETQIQLILPSLAVSIVHTLTALSKNINEAIAENIMFIITNILKICNVIFKEQPDNGSDLIKYIRNIFNSLESMFKLDSYSKLKSNLVDQLKECAPHLKNDKLLKKHVLAIYNTNLNKNLADISEEVVKAFEIVEVSNSVNLTPKQKENSRNCTTPSGKAAKKSKKEATITNTVFENGEEFVVVKSHWKFNPRKLTENQKEKLQRKREDIPAMYQDLSQSQDEFKLTTWKTDSQDTSTTSSKSTNLAANENVSVILKKLPNSDFFPKIMENVTTKPVIVLTQDTESSKEKVNSNNAKSENEKIKNVQNSVKNDKSPRMALKDRVSRNVRNLIERSYSGQECTDVSVNILKTPDIAKVNPSGNVTNSAPSQINLERPSRVKRKPKKFDDLKLFALTKRRRSLSISDSKNDVEITGNQIQIKNDTKKNSVEDKHKENDVVSQELINIDNSEETKGNINNVEHHGNDKLENKVSVTNCFDVTEILNHTNDTVKHFFDKEKETACVDSNNRALQTRNLNETDEKPGQISGSQDLNDVDKTVHDKIEENIVCTVSLDNTLSTLKSNQSKDSNNINQSVHNDVTEMVQENVYTVTFENTVSTSKSNESKDLNNINQSVHVKINEKVQEKICTVTLEKFLFKPKSYKCEEKFERKTSTDSEKNIVLSPKIKKKDSDEKRKLYPDESKSNAVPTAMDIKKKVTTQGKSCPDNTDNSKLFIISSDKIETVNEKIEGNICDNDNIAALPSPKVTGKVIDKQICSSKKSNTKKSRIESQLAIDMVEGHPFLKAQSEKRSTRKANLNSPLKRKRLSYNPDNNKLKRKNTTKEENKTKNKEISISIKDTQNSEDICASQDFIESSQDSAVTTISVKSSKPLANKVHAVVEDVIHAKDSSDTDTQNLIDISTNIDLTNLKSNSDIELPCNKTYLTNLTEEMDTEPIDYNVIVVLSDDEGTQIPVISDKRFLKSDTQNTADADTEPVDPNIFIETNVRDKPSNLDEKDVEENTQITGNPEPYEINVQSAEIIEDNETNASLMTIDEDATKTLSESVLIEAVKDDSNTSCNNERKRDFLDNTLQISPIKSMSPVLDEKSPSPETSSDYVVIKLTSPVQSNGQPFEICESPEIFTEDKVSPDKRDQSPPREEVSVKSTSPSSSLSLKKNRAQMRPGGRAAQMLGLCVPDSLQTMTVSEKPIEPEEAKRSSCLNTSARRNLRLLYSNDTSDDTEESESFLKFKRTLPTTDCSPSGPILKRKIIDLTDEPTASPASKRKRVSFHDPPVSTSICVKKYLEPISLRSPQNSANKRLERQTRVLTVAKSPRRLENVFKLDSVLNKAVESFSDAPETMNEDTEMSSLDETPVVEVIKTSDLNDTDPICKELVDCEDHIENIAAELSSPAMKALLVKKFEGKVDCIGDLAKMTELEVNRLCIKAPKVQVAKKVLNGYLSKLKQASEEITPTVEAAMTESTVLEAKLNKEIQTDTAPVESVEAQTDCVAVSLATSQTDEVKITHSFVQTNESGSKSTADIISDCVSQRPDFVERLCETMDETSKQKIVENLPYDTLIKIIMDKISNGDGKHVLSILQDHLVKRFDCKYLILFCSSLLQKVYDKPE